MIRPGKPARAIAKSFVVADIENRESGKLITIDTYNGVTHWDSRSWQGWLDLIRDQLARGNKAFRRIYAHNGSGWDWLSFVQWLIEEGYWVEYVRETILSGDTLIALQLHIDGHKVMLCDSMLLFRPEPASLDALGKKFAGRGKMDTGGKLPRWLWDNNRELYWKYLYGDTELLYEVLSKVHDLIFTIAPIASIGLTAPSTAMKIWRTRFLKDTLYTPEQADVKEALRDGYHGGRVEVFREGHHKKIRVYDVNSMYPAVMASTPVPSSGKVLITTKPNLDGCGIFKVRFKERKRNKPPLLLVNGYGAHEGEGWYYAPELRRFKGELEVLEGYQFEDTSVLFKEYVDVLYNLRMGDKEGPMGSLCKIAMNGLYGKLAQKPERNKLVIASISELDGLIVEGKQPVCINEEYGLYMITEQADVPHEHVGIAGTITSEARGRLWEATDSDTIYVDTDSVHTTGKVPVDPTKLGAWKLEFEGEGVYRGKKLYGLRNPDKTKIRAKGIRVHDKKKYMDQKLGCDLSFEGLLSLEEGASLVCHFRSAPTLNNVLHGGTACTFEPRYNKTVARKRTIRSTVDARTKAQSQAAAERSRANKRRRNRADF